MNHSEAPSDIAQEVVRLFKNLPDGKYTLTITLTMTAGDLRADHLTVTQKYDPQQVPILEIDRKRS